MNINVYSVYPESGIDLYSRIQCRVVDAYGNSLLEDGIVTLTEGNTYTQDIAEGKLNTTSVYFQFRGNTNDEAYATVSYDAN